MPKRIIVTGGAGFIGSNFLHLIASEHPECELVNIDTLTYSGNLENVKDLVSNPRYSFHNVNICDRTALLKILREGDTITNFAAETHVDNSILGSAEFIRSNILGVQTLLDVARERKVGLFLQVSTDEVYGSLTFDQRPSQEEDRFCPSSPYSASKAAAEHLCTAAYKTHGLPTIITRSSNNFGPYQFPEKVIPLFVTNLIEGRKIPLYGQGKNIRDWIYVEDNCRAIDVVIQKGKVGEAYNIGGGNELSNLELTRRILVAMGKEESFIERVTDRLGHDLRYALYSSKIQALGWSPRYDFDQALRETIEWYKHNPRWWGPLKRMPGRRTS